MEIPRSKTADVFQLEEKFREKIYELQRTTDALEKLEKEHLLVREQLCSKDTLLQNERRTSEDLRSRLKSSSEMISRLEEEKMRERVESSKLSIEHACALKVRETLAQEANDGRTEAARLKLRVETLEEQLSKESRRKEELEGALLQLKNDGQRIVGNIDVNIRKLAREQKYLEESCRSTIQLNKRLQVLGLCYHAIDRKNKSRIEELERELIGGKAANQEATTVDVLPHPEIEDLCSKLKDTLRELKFNLQSSRGSREDLNEVLDELDCH